MEKVLLDRATDNLERFLQTLSTDGFSEDAIDNARKFGRGMMVVLVADLLDPVNGLARVQELAKSR